MAETFSGCIEQNTFPLYRGRKGTYHTSLHLKFVSCQNKYVLRNTDTEKRCKSGLISAIPRQGRSGNNYEKIVVAIRIVISASV